MKYNIWINFNFELFFGGRDNILLNVLSFFLIERKLLFVLVVNSI